MRGDAATALDIKLQGSRCKAKRHQHRKPALPKYDACCHHLSGDYDNTRTSQRTHWLMAPLHASAQRHAGLKGASFWKTPYSSPTPGYRCDERCPRVGNTSRWVRRSQAAIMLSCTVVHPDKMCFVPSSDTHAFTVVAVRMTGSFLRMICVANGCYRRKHCLCWYGDDNCDCTIQSTTLLPRGRPRRHA